MKRCTNSAMWKPFDYTCVKGCIEGKQLGGALVAAIDSWGVRDKGKTLEVVVVMNDRRMALYQFARGKPITAYVVSA